MVDKKGFEKRKVEKAIQYCPNKENIDEILKFLIKSENGWDHKFIRSLEDIYKYNNNIINEMLNKKKVVKYVETLKKSIFKIKTKQNLKD